MGRRVVVTGIGVVAPNGIGRSEFWDALIKGKSGIGPITRFERDSLPCNAVGEVGAFVPSQFIRRESPAHMGRFSQFAVAAGRLAVDDAGLADSSAAVCIGTSVQGNADVGEAAHSDFLKGGWQALNSRQGLEVAAHAATAHVQAELGLTGPVMTIASACCTGVDAIAWGAGQISSGSANSAVVGAAEAPLSKFTLSLFVAGGFISSWNGPPEEASRPYDLRRSGLVLSEGSAALVLEDMDNAMARGATIYAEVLGYASSAETGLAHDPRERYSSALQQAITRAVSLSQLTPESIDYICAHGNSTQFDDRVEAAAHRAVFRQHAYRIPVSSIKSMIGQPFSAGGVMQAAATALAVKNRVVPPTINYQHPDPDCDLDYVPNEARVARVNHAIFHSHSLGGSVRGSHSAMVLGSLET